MKKCLFLSLLILSAMIPAAGQLKVLSVVQINVPAVEQWSNPKYSPDGTSLFLTNGAYNGIWNFDLRSNRLIEITRDPSSGYGFSVSPDGNKLVYRKTLQTNEGARRKQEIIIYDMLDKSSRILNSGDDVSEPRFIDGTVVYATDGSLKNENKPSASGTVFVLGIENAKISLLKNGEKILFDPFGDGHYIWPSLSPDKKNIIAYDMDRGTFLCDLSGSILKRYGRMDAPVWTRDGNWIISMDDRDDGHVMLSSRIKAVSADGTIFVNLTNEASRIDLNPDCSPTGNSIVFNTDRGEIYILSYEEVR